MLKFCTIISYNLKKIKSKPLTEGEVRVFLAEIDRFEESLNLFKEVLSEEEKARANRFFEKTDRDRYIIRHGIFRKVISHYIALSAKEVQIITDENKRPFLSPETHIYPIDISLTSSKNMFAFCLARNTRVGIDIEMLVDDPDYRGIAENFFSEEEIEFINQFKKEELAEAFLKIWTAKEAFIKANRLIEPNQFTVSFSSFPNYLKPVYFDNKFWYLYTPDLSREFILTVSSDQQTDSISVKNLTFSDL